MVKSSYQVFDFEKGMVMYKSILVPYDNSDHAREALKVAIEMAQISDGKVTLLSVADVPDFNDPGFVAAARVAGVRQLSEEEIMNIQREFYATQKAALIEEAGEFLGDFDRVEYRATAGKPQHVICEFAESGNFDLIVMGCRGLGPLRGAMGSVSYAVARSVKLPVLIIK